jgi:hypothetical protein
MDMTNSFFQTCVHPDDVHLTAVTTPLGLYEWLAMSMGLRNSPAIHQRRMTAALRGLIGKIFHIYLDDIVIWSNDIAEHTKHIDLVMAALRKAHLYCNPAKCRFYLKELDFLGHHISARRIELNSSKVECVMNWPVPTSATEVQSFLGLVTEVQISDPEHETLHLPFDIALDKHAEYGLSHFAVEELQLHEGEAYDALDSVQHAVKYVTCLCADKCKHAKGQMMNLHAGDLVRDAENKQAKCVVKYQHARLAMISLGRSAEYLQETFPEMKPQDLWMRDVSNKHKVGDGMITEGWIWRVGAMENMSEEEQDAFSKDSE